MPSFSGLLFFQPFKVIVSGLSSGFSEVGIRNLTSGSSSGSCGFGIPFIRGICSISCSGFFFSVGLYGFETGTISGFLVVSNSSGIYFSINGLSNSVGLNSLNVNVSSSFSFFFWDVSSRDSSFLGFCLISVICLGFCIGVFFNLTSSSIILSSCFISPFPIMSFCGSSSVSQAS